MPSACCTSPVVADGKLYFAGWSPGDPEDKEFQDADVRRRCLKDDDADERRHPLERRVAEDAFKDFFDNNDPNKDGKITRDEWDAISKFMAEREEQRVRPQARRHRRHHEVARRSGRQTKGLPYVPSAIVYRGQYVMVKDGGIVTAYDAKTGERALPEAGRRRRQLLRLAGGGRTEHLLHVARRRRRSRCSKAGPKKPEVVAENPPLGERVAATPAIADDTLYIRTAGHLYAFKEE